MSREIRVAILGDSRDFSRAVRDAQQDAGRLDGAFGRVAGGAGRMAAGVALGAAGVAVAGGAMAMSFVQAAEESQQVSRQTEAVLRSMGAGAWATADGIAALSERLSLQTGIDDELIQSGQNVLLTFGEVQNRVGEGNDIFDRATAAALDMSVALGTDMSSSAMQVGRALNDPIRGLAALRRSGIQFTAQQEEQIRAMVEAGDVAGAQRVMLAELERQFGGSAEAQSTASQRMSVAWGNLQEKLGEQLLPVFESVANWLSNNLPQIMATAEQWIGRFRDGISRVVDFVREHWPAIQDTIQRFVDWVGPIITNIVGYIQGAWATFGDEILSIAQTVWNTIRTVIESALTVIQGIINVVMGIVHGDWDQVWNGIKGVAEGVWNAIKGVIEGALGILRELIGGALEGIAGFFSETWDDIVDAVSRLPGRIGSAASGMWDGIKDAFRAAVNWIIRGWNSLEFTLPSISTPIGDFGGWTLGTPNIPTLHSGGIFQAPNGADEGLALLQSGERVLSRGQTAAMGAGRGGDLVLVLNGRELGRAALDGLIAVNRSDGPLPLSVA